MLGAHQGLDSFVTPIVLRYDEDLDDLVARQWRMGRAVRWLYLFPVVLVLTGVVFGLRGPLAWLSWGNVAVVVMVVGLAWRRHARLRATLRRQLDALLAGAGEESREAVTVEADAAGLWRRAPSGDLWVGWDAVVAMKPGANTLWIWTELGDLVRIPRAAAPAAPAWSAFVASCQRAWRDGPSGAPPRWPDGLTTAWTPDPVRWASMRCDVLRRRGVLGRHRWQTLVVAPANGIVLFGLVGIFAFLRITSSLYVAAIVASVVAVSATALLMLPSLRPDLHLRLAGFLTARWARARYAPRRVTLAEQGLFWGTDRARHAVSWDRIEAARWAGDAWLLEVPYAWPIPIGLDVGDPRRVEVEAVLRRRLGSLSPPPVSAAPGRPESSSPNPFAPPAV